MNSTLIDDIFNSQLKLKNKYRFIERDERIKKLLMLKNWIFNNRQKLRDAMYADYLKPAVEVDLWESHVVISEINHTIRQLKKWMKPIHVRRTLLLATTRSYIHYQPNNASAIFKSVLVVIFIFSWFPSTRFMAMPISSSKLASSVKCTLKSCL